jgi:Cysteine rich repeat
MKRLLVVLLVCVVTLVLVSAAFAQQAKPQAKPQEVKPEVAKPCAGDVAKFCKDVKPGEGRIAKCLKENKDQLSTECKAHVAKVKEALKEVNKACEDDITMFCAGVQPGEGRVIKCLKEHKAELSSKCQEGITKAKEKKEKK